MTPDKEIIVRSFDIKGVDMEGGTDSNQFSHGSMSGGGSSCSSEDSDGKQSSSEDEYLEAEEHEEDSGDEDGLQDERSQDNE